MTETVLTSLDVFTGFPGDHGALVIRKGKVTIAGNNIIESSSNYGLLAFLKTLLSNDAEAKKTKLAVEGFHQDGVTGLAGAMLLQEN